MKKLTLIIGLLIFTSCTISKEKQLVSDYEQRIGNTKTDLNLKFTKFEFVDDILAKDSAIILTEYFNIKKLEKIEEAQKNIKNINIVVQPFEELKSNSNMSEENFNLITKDFYEDIEHNKSIIDLYNGDCKDTFLEPVLAKINIFESKPDSVLSKKYDVTYAILNPMLNNVKQTLSKTYFINSELTKILNVVENEPFL